MLMIEMELKKLHMGTVVFGFDSMDEVSHLLALAFGDNDDGCELGSWRAGRRDGEGLMKASRRKNSQLAGPTRGRRDMSTRLHEAVMALATCHNVGVL